MMKVLIHAHNNQISKIEDFQKSLSKKELNDFFKFISFDGLVKIQNGLTG